MNTILFLAACNATTEENTNTQRSGTVVKIRAEDELKIIEQNGKSFYDWYFKNDFPNCGIIKDKNGKCLVDTISYFENLRKLGTISEKFISKEKERLQGCAGFISTIDYSEYEHADAYEYDTYCPDMYYMYWIKSQEPPNSFSTRNIKKNGNKLASVDIYENYGGKDEPLSTVILEKEGNVWKITGIHFIHREKTETRKVDISGKWYGGIVALNIGETSLAFEYHGQCVYFYPIRKMNENEFEMIWARDMDCKFDNGTKETFGLKEVPEIGEPFAKFRLQNNVLHAQYYYPEWVEKYTQNVQEDVFTEKYFRKNEK